MNRREAIGSLPRMEHPDQLDLIPHLDRVIAEQQAEARVKEAASAAEAARHAVGGNGGPSLDDAPSYAHLERIGRLIYGQLWTGKLAFVISEHERDIRRWRDGQGVPTQRAMNSTKRHALCLAGDLLRAIGEPDLAGPIDVYLDKWNLDLAKRGRVLHKAKMAAAAERDRKAREQRQAARDASVA